MAGVERAADDASATASPTAVAPTGKETHDDAKGSPPRATVGEGDATARQRRKDKIMQSREDRLAKILSMASGRPVDPKEVHLDRTPSPTVSEVAAAGVGPVLKAPLDESITLSSSPASSPLTHARHNVVRLSPGSRGRHTIIIVLAAALFSLWSVYWNGTKLSSSFEPWQVALSVFFVIQSVEGATGRLQPRGLLSDCALFVFVILLMTKVLARRLT